MISLDLISDKIYNSQTKEYFKEALVSYHTKNYRACVVMLYSIVICDIIYKLEELKDIYNDKTAITLLENISKSQKNGNTRSEWEGKLIEDVAERTELIGEIELNNFKYLQKHRHLSAHPVLTENYKLHSPTQEVARAHLRNVLEGFLIKAPILSKKIFVDFLLDLESKQHLFPEREDKSLSKYLNVKYFKHCSDTTISYLFKNLWRTIFKDSSFKANKNRLINYRALIIIIEQTKGDRILQVKEKPEYFMSGVLEAEEIYNILIELFTLFPEFYYAVDENNRVIIDSLMNKSIEYQIMFWFLASNPKNHISEIQRLYKDGLDYRVTSLISRSEAVFTAINGLKNNGINKKELYQCIIELYTKSGTYDEASILFSNIILPELNDFDKDDILLLISGIEKNSQTYGRRNSASDHHNIISIINEKFSRDINLDDYPKLTR